MQEVSTAIRVPRRRPASSNSLAALICVTGGGQDSLDGDLTHNAGY